MYISIEPNESGAYPPLISFGAEGLLEFPQQFEELFYESNGFVKLIVKDDIIVDCVQNKQARQTWFGSVADAISKKDTEAKISELKQLLSETDYQAIKYAEGELSEEEYADMKAQRAAWRKEINELEAII